MKEERGLCGADGGQRQLHASAAQERSSKSSLWVRVRPGEGDISLALYFLTDFTLFTSRAFQHRRMRIKSSSG